jgi:leader peptidase (prepilin peptidase) / N-methyltransferase
MLTVVALVGGLLIGPLLGILVDRVVPRIRLSAEHRCVGCETGLGRGSLVPVANWFQPCLACGRSVWWRYPAVDLATAVVFAALTHRFGASWRLGPYLALGAVLVVLSVIDLETHLLPNRLTWPAIGTGLFLILVVSGELGDAAGARGAFVGAAAFGGFVGLVHLIYEAGMGRGDVKLSLLLGMFVGWLAPGALIALRLVLYALFLAFLGGGLIGLAYNLIRRRGRRAEIPFGPALAAGALAVVLVSGPLVTAR